MAGASRVVTTVAISAAARAAWEKVEHKSAWLEERLLSQDTEIIRCHLAHIEALERKISEIFRRLRLEGVYRCIDCGWGYEAIRARGVTPHLCFDCVEQRHAQGIALDARRRS